MDPLRRSAPSAQRIRTSRRLFVGIVPDDAARTACATAVDALRRTGFSAKFEEIDKLHATLAFLGNVDDARYEPIVAAMRQVAKSCAPLSVILDKVGAFPHERKPRIIYAGACEQGAGFRTLCSSLRSAYAKLGFTFKEDAVAHVTIARVKDPRRPLPLIELTPTPLGITELTLFESIFDKEKNTSRYEVSATARLHPDRR
jgi:RNA 2',3'-cyclic 3'-phosphodiesterase